MLSRARTWAPYAAFAVAVHAVVVWAAFRDATPTPKQTPIHVTLVSKPPAPPPRVTPPAPQQRPPEAPRPAVHTVAHVVAPAPPTETSAPRARPKHKASGHARSTSSAPSTPSGPPADSSSGGPPHEGAPPGEPPTQPAAPGDSASKESDGDAFDIAGYGRALSAAIHARKSYPRAAERRGVEGTVSVHLVVGRDGRLTGAPTVQKSSGDDDLDAQAVTMVQEASPFPSLSSACRQSSLEFVIPIDFTLRR